MKNSIRLLGMVLFVCIIGHSCTKESNKVAREDFFGTYGCVETRVFVPNGNTSEKNYDFSVIAGTADDEIFIDNFAGQYWEKTAKVTGSSIEIGSPGDSLTGSGNLDGNILNITYHYQYEPYYTWNGTCVCTKK